MNALSGTRRLFRLNLRLDRVRLPIWIIVIVGIIALTLPQLLDAYGTETERLQYTVASSASGVTRLLNGAITGTSDGNIAVVETFLLSVLLMSLMNIFLVTRHTRQEEESNRSELIESMLVGRQAGLSAALLLAFFVNLITAGLIFGVFAINNYPLAGSLAYSSALGLLGMVFAGVAAITAQLFESTRTANSVAGLVFGLSFALRGIGDILGQLKPGGLGVTPNFISWFSPVGWVLNINAFTGERWWVLGLFGGLTVACVVVAYVLLSKRDVGASLFASRLGRAHAKPQLLRRFGLAWRLNRVSTIAWLSGIAAGGATIGAVAHEFVQLVAENEEMQQLLAQIGGNKNITDLLFSIMFMILAIATTAYSLQIVTRLRSEETSGRLELLLSTGHSRSRWLLTSVIYSLVTIVIILATAGFTAGLVFGLIGGDLWHNVVSLTGSILVYVPALAVLVGLAVTIFGRFPRWFVAFAWASLAASLMIFQLGAILKLPQWAINLSPFSHTPLAPSNTVDWVPLVLQSAVALAFGLAGFWLLKRRDIATS